MPRKAGERLAGSYANFYLPNGGVIAPQFGGEASEADARCASCQGPASQGSVSTFGACCAAWQSLIS